MRIRIPIIPLAVSVERDPRGSFRWQIGLRGLLLLVAFVAVVLAIWMGNRRERYRRLMIYWAVQEQRILGDLQRAQAMADNPSVSAAMRTLVVQRIADRKSDAAHHRQRSEFYRNAISRPWRWVPIDVPDDDFNNPKYAEEYRWWMSR
jgi:hypothetical protein